MPNFGAEMKKTNKLIILGCGSALPVKQHFPSSQILEIRSKQYMIDCGEGAQIRMRQMGLTAARLGHIFISHLHGDHVFGIMGIISSFGMLNRTADLHIHAPEPLEKLLQPQLDFFCDELPFKIIFHTFDTRKNVVIHEDHSLKVSSIPLKHKVPCAGFLFEEIQGDRHIRRDMIDFYNIPISKIPKIKQGEDFITETGEVIKNEQLTTPPNPAARFAYCSDTAYCERIIPIIKDVDLLYHEATFMNDEIARARATLHSTAEQAARIALKANVKQLIIGHFSARYSDKTELLREATKIFQNTILAEDTKTFEF